MGVEKKTYIACPGATSQPGATCDFCGQAIVYVFKIRSADGKEWGIGCDCVRHIGDTGLTRVATQEQKKIDKANRDARNKKHSAAGAAWWAENRERFVNLPHPHQHHAANGLSLADYYDFCLQSSSDSTRAAIYRRLQNTF